MEPTMKITQTVLLTMFTLLCLPAFAADEEPAALLQMHGHMQEMQKTMSAIAEGMGMMQDEPGSAGAPGGMQGMSMEQRMVMLEQRMEMMQMMMGQMMEHDQQQAEAPATQHEH